jgi:hypothetical protein
MRNCISTRRSSCVRDCTSRNRALSRAKIGIAQGGHRHEARANSGELAAGSTVGRHRRRPADPDYERLKEFPLGYLVMGDASAASTRSMARACRWRSQRRARSAIAWAVGEGELAPQQSPASGCRVEEAAMLTEAQVEQSSAAASSWDGDGPLRRVAVRAVQRTRHEPSLAKYRCWCISTSRRST